MWIARHRRVVLTQFHDKILLVHSLLAYYHKENKDCTKKTKAVVKAHKAGKQMIMPNSIYLLPF